MFSIVQIDYTNMQNEQNSRRFLYIMTAVVQYAQKTIEMLKLFVQNRKSYNSVTLMTKGYKTVTKILQMPHDFAHITGLPVWFMILSLYIISA